MGLHAFLREKYPLLSKNLNKQFMPVSLKFLVVRHPFERVISAYMDKVEDWRTMQEISSIVVVTSMLCMVLIFWQNINKTRLGCFYVTAILSLG